MRKPWALTQCRRPRRRVPSAATAARVLGAVAVGVVAARRRWGGIGTAAPEVASEARAPRAVPAAARAPAGAAPAWPRAAARVHALNRQPYDVAAVNAAVAAGSP